MPLTPEERTQVIGWLKTYPKGISSSAWGYGPMATLNDDENENDYSLPGEFAAETRAAYG